MRHSVKLILSYMPNYCGNDFQLNMHHVAIPGLEIWASIVPFSFVSVLNKYLFQECEGSLKHKTELITKLEAKTLSMSETIQKMDEKYVLFAFISVN